jgi:lipoprotein-anchoring transpeptidase ErfK/SrfK
MEGESSTYACQPGAEPVASSQPLTRHDCDKAGKRWLDGANVCGEEAKESALGATPRSQPLTRPDCDKAAMTWNEDANVCSSDSTTRNIAGSPTGSSAKTDEQRIPIVINIDKTKQKMSVLLNGVEKYKWPVSTGRPSYFTPSGDYAATSMNEVWYSKEWDNAPMPHSIFFTKDGHAIHGSYELKQLGRPASHGCVRIAPKNAATLYALVATNGIENTQVVLTGLTPGGEGRVASSSARSAKPATSAPRKSRDARVTRPAFWLEEGRPKRRGLFGRRFGGANYERRFRPPPVVYYRRQGY